MVRDCLPFLTGCLSGCLHAEQMGHDGASLASMQGLQPYLQAIGSQSLPNNLLHSHPSLQGELAQMYLIWSDAMRCISQAYLMGVTSAAVV